MSNAGKPGHGKGIFRKRYIDRKTAHGWLSMASKACEEARTELGQLGETL